MRFKAVPRTKRRGRTISKRRFYGCPPIPTRHIAHYANSKGINEGGILGHIVNVKSVLGNGHLYVEHRLKYDILQPVFDPDDTWSVCIQCERLVNPQHLKNDRCLFCAAYPLTEWKTPDWKLRDSTECFLSKEDRKQVREGISLHQEWKGRKL